MLVSTIGCYQVGVQDIVRLYMSLLCIIIIIAVLIMHVLLLQFVGAYTVSKVAILGLVKVLAGELGGDSIRVNCIAPGLIETKFGEIVSEYTNWVLHKTSLACWLL